MAKKPGNREPKKTKQRAQLSKKEAYRSFMINFKPLIIAVLLWIITIFILHLPAFKSEVALFFVKFTLNSALVFGNTLFMNVESHSYPYITVDGYTMRVVVECTAYNFYFFVIYLSLLSPVKWKQRIITMVIFIAVIFFLNNMRFIIMGFVGFHYAHMFHFIHDYIWDFLFGFMIFLIWVWRYNVNPGGRDLKEQDS